MSMAPDSPTSIRRTIAPTVDACHTSDLRGLRPSRFKVAAISPTCASTRSSTAGSADAVVEALSPGSLGGPALLRAPEVGKCREAWPKAYQGSPWPPCRSCSNTIALNANLESAIIEPLRAGRSSHPQPPTAPDLRDPEAVESSVVKGGPRRIPLTDSTSGPQRASGGKCKSASSRIRRKGDGTPPKEA